MSSEQLLNSEHVETDIVIVGAGGAGLTAAVTAAEKGAKVIVIEKGRKPGGLSAMAGNGDPTGWCIRLCNRGTSRNLPS
mgnify:CR=1 FL=1